jgi:hypothetical protein
MKENKIPLACYEIDWNGDGLSDRQIATDGKFVPWNGFDSCNVRFRAVDVAGNTSDWTDSVHMHMDTENPRIISWSETKNGVVKLLYVFGTDNIKVHSVQAKISTETGNYTNWKTAQAVWDSKMNTFRIDLDPKVYGTAGHYKVIIYMYDEAGNYTNSKEILTEMHVHTAACYHKHDGNETTGGDCYKTKTTGTKTCTISKYVANQTTWTCPKPCYGTVNHTHYLGGHSECGASGYNYKENICSKCGKVTSDGSNWSAGSHQYTATVYKKTCGYEEGQLDCGY